jgi:hypothetical protein
VTAVPSPGVATEELRAVLELSLGRPIVDLRRQQSPYASSFPLEDVWVRTNDGVELALILKDLSPVQAEQMKPSLVFNPRREVEAYRSMLDSRTLGTARCYAAVADATRERYWLVLEKVQGVELYQVGDLAVWQAAARWLAQIHIGLARVAALPDQPDFLLHHSVAFYRVWPARAMAHARSPEQFEALSWLAARHDQIVDRLMTLPVTIIHGEYYASNIVVQLLASGIRVCPIDWEMVGLGPGLMDLAALTAGSWSDAARLALTEAYRDGVANLGGHLQPVDEFQVALDCCRLQLALQWLGWSAAWQPPPAHAQDWLAEALAVAARLGL